MKEQTWDTHSGSFPLFPPPYSDFRGTFEDYLLMVEGVTGMSVCSESVPRLPGRPFCHLVVPVGVCVLNVFETGVCRITELLKPKRKDSDLLRCLSFQCAACKC